MTDEPERDFLVEAQMILKGMKLTVTREHLDALEEHYECKLIRMAHQLAHVHKEALDDHAS